MVPVLVHGSLLAEVVRRRIFLDYRYLYGKTFFA